MEKISCIIGCALAIIIKLAIIGGIILFILNFNTVLKYVGLSNSHKTELKSGANYNAESKICEGSNHKDKHQNNDNLFLYVVIGFIIVVLVSAGDSGFSP